MVTMAMCSRSPSRSSTGTDERSARQVKRPLGFFANAVLGVRLALVLGKAAQIVRRSSGNSSLAAMTWRGIPPSATSVVRNTSCRRTTSFKARSRAGMSSRPTSLTAAGM